MYRTQPITAIISSISDWLYPPKCIACRIIMPINQPQRYICVHCLPLFEAITAPVCARCGAPINPQESNEPIEATSNCPSCFGKHFHFAQNRSAFIYEEIMRDVMHDMKFRNKKRVAQGLGLLWADILKTKNEANFPPSLQSTQSTHALVPLPMYGKKQRRRGFNQADILATAISQVLHIPVEKALVRGVDTPPQSGLHPKRREENVRGAFSINPHVAVAGKNFILVDDIFTTGASINECAKTLINAGAAGVSCLTLAITLKEVFDKT